jgi:hypothetical protein
VNEPHPPPEPDNTKYDLVVGDKVYILILDINDQSSPDTLDKLADQQVGVKGEASADTIRSSQ